MTPEGKTITAKGNAMGVVIAQLAEVVVGLGAIWLRATDHLTEQSFMIIVGAIVAGPFISHARGKDKVPTTIMAAGVGGSILAAAAKAKALIG